MLTEGQTNNLVGWEDLMSITVSLDRKENSPTIFATVTQEEIVLEILGKLTMQPQYQIGGEL